MLSEAENISRCFAQVKTVHALEDLASIHDHTCAGVLCQRPQMDGFQAWLNKLDPELLPEGRIIISPEEVPSSIRVICSEAGLPDCPEKDLWIKDVEALAQIFSKIMSAPYLQLKLNVVTSNACKKFHQDYLTARLVCSYRGPGTQYGISIKGQDPKEIFNAPTSAPFIMRGKIWSTSEENKLLHRSPPIEGTGIARLILVLDPVDNQ